MGNQYTSGSYSLDKRIEDMKKKLNELYPEYEYVSGYYHSDCKIIIKCKRSGHQREVSYISIRHGTMKHECSQCVAEDKIKQKELKHKRIEFEKSIKPFKYKEIEMKECPVCRAFYFTWDSKSKYCSKECAKKSCNQQQNRKKDFRKRISKTEESKDITLLALYKRDKGICWLCGGICDYTLDGNDDMYPSIDHVIPISKGGKDLWSNVRLAHRRCNRVKSNHIIYSPFA